MVENATYLKHTAVAVGATAGEAVGAMVEGAEVTAEMAEVVAAVAAEVAVEGCTSRGSSPPSTMVLTPLTPSVTSQVKSGHNLVLMGKHISGGPDSKILPTLALCNKSMRTKTMSKNLWTNSRRMNAGPPMGPSLDPVPMVPPRVGIGPDARSNLSSLGRDIDR